MACKSYIWLFLTTTGSTKLSVVIRRKFCVFTLAVLYTLYIHMCIPLNIFLGLVAPMHTYVPVLIFAPVSYTHAICIQYSSSFKFECTNFALSIYMAALRLSEYRSTCNGHPQKDKIPMKHIHISSWSLFNFYFSFPTDLTTVLKSTVYQQQLRSDQHE